jgi:hypothetical protein
MRTLQLSVSLAALSCLVPLAQAATVTIIATAAKNVSDYAEISNGSGGFNIVKDGLGDQVATNAYPWLSAGINLSGASGQNGTARFQMEFSLAGLTSPIMTAFLVLNSDPSPNNTLPTTFYHVTNDEDGVINASDFQSPAVSTGIVQNPVALPATHSYDVTSFVQQDLTNGFNYSSFQGRVSDENADTAFRLALEYFSMALDVSANNDPALRPRLVVTTAEIPEPATFVIMGSGLLGLAALARRRSV